MSEDSLKSLLDEYEDLVPSCHESSDSLMNRAKLLAQACHITRYHLVANVCQDSSVNYSVGNDVDVYTADSSKRKDGQWGRLL